MFKEKLGPFLSSKNDTKKIMLTLVLSLVPICLFTIYKNGIIPYLHDVSNLLDIFRIVLFLILGPVTTYTTEYVYSKLFLKDKKDYFINSYSFIPGLFLSLLLPVNTPFIYLIFGGIISIVIGKMLFGGFGQNVFNPALIGYLFIMNSYSSKFTFLNNYEVDTITSATPLSNLNLVNEITYDTVVKPFGSLWDFFIGTIPGSMGETSAILCLIAMIFLIFRKVIKWRIPITYIGTVFITTLIISLTNDIGIWYPFFHILSGGLLFGAIFMATDPVTSPTTKNGQIIYGISLGILTVVLRLLTNNPEGVCISILTMNMLVFIVEKISVNVSYKKKGYLYYLIPFTIIILLLGFSINFSKDKIDSNFNIISKEKINDAVKYAVDQKGNGGKIEAAIVIKNNKVMSIEILKHNETSSYYSKVIDSDYINKLINSTNLEELDTISGATITSTALKKMVINTLEDYKNYYGDNYE